MKYSLPCNAQRQTQGFGENPQIYLKLMPPCNGHMGHDWAFDKNEPIPLIAKSFVYSKRNENNPDLNKYTAVYTLVDNGEEVDEISYGHLNSMNVEVGKWYDEGEIVGLAGNRGYVMSGGKEVTLAEKLNGSGKGTHLHLQKRPCIKVKKTNKGKKYLEDANGKFKKDGFYYELKNSNDDRLGCEEIIFTNKIATKTPVVIEDSSKQIALLRQLLDLAKRLLKLLKV